METIEAILLANEQDMIQTYTGKYWGTLTVMEMMREYAKEQLTDVQRMLQGNDIDGIGEYIKKLKGSI